MEPKKVSPKLMQEFLNWLDSTKGGQKGSVKTCIGCTHLQPVRNWTNQAQEMCTLWSMTCINSNSRPYYKAPKAIEETPVGSK